MNQNDRIFALSTLWKHADVVFPYFDRNPIDWDAAYRETLAQICDGGEADFHLLMTRFLARLGDGHTDYLPPRRLRETRGFAPFRLEYDGAWYVRYIAPEGAALLGAEVTTLNGVPFEDFLGRITPYCYHIGACIYPSKLDLLLPFFVEPRGNVLGTQAGDFPFDLTSPRPELLHAPRDTGSLPLLSTSDGLVLRRAGDILLAEIPDLLHGGTAKYLAEAMDTQRPEKVVLDLRDCIGGMTSIGAEIAQLFIDGEFPVCAKWTRSLRGSDLAVASQYGRELRDERLLRVVHRMEFEHYVQRLGTPGRKACFTGPVTLLTSRATISAAEELCAMFRANARARLIGQSTHGSTGTPLLLRLPDDATARIVSIGTRLTDGTEFIGCGIVPECSVPARKALRAALAE